MAPEGQEEPEKEKKKKKNRRKKNRKKKCVCPCHTINLDPQTGKTKTSEDMQTYCTSCGPVTDTCTALTSMADFASTFNLHNPQHKTGDK